MPDQITSVARVATDRPARYGKQLVSHLTRRLTGSWDADAETGALALGDGGDHADLATESGALLLTIQADPAQLDRWEDVLGRHLVRFGAKDELVATWTRSDGSTGTTQRVDDPSHVPHQPPAD